MLCVWNQLDAREIHSLFTAPDGVAAGMPATPCGTLSQTYSKHRCLLSSWQHTPSKGDRRAFFSIAPWTHCSRVPWARALCWDIHYTCHIPLDQDKGAAEHVYLDCDPEPCTPGTAVYEHLLMQDVSHQAFPLFCPTTFLCRFCFQPYSSGNNGRHSPPRP